MWSRTASRSSPWASTPAARSWSRATARRRGTMSAPITIAAIASASWNPVNVITSAAAITATRAERVVQHLEERRAQVEVLGARRREHRDGCHVAEQPDDAENHQLGHDLGWLEQATHGLDHDEHPDRRENRRLCCRPSTSAGRSPTCAGGRRPIGQPRGDRAIVEATGVREHVGRVDEQREAAGDDRSDHLGDQHYGRDAESDRESPPAARYRVIVGHSSIVPLSPRSRRPRGSLVGAGTRPCRARPTDRVCARGRAG